MGVNTTNGYFYKPILGASGTTEMNLFHAKLDIADAQIEANKTVTPSFDSIQFDTDFSDGQETGRLQWNDTDGTLEIGMKGDAVKLQVGQEVLTRVVNKSGAQIDKGKPVYVDGMQGVRPTISYAKADSRTTMDTLIGLATENIADNAEGYVTLIGLVRDVDTDSWNVGDILYVSPDTAGLLVTTRPTSPDVVGAIGSVFVKHSSQGLIGIKMTVHPTIVQLSDTPENYTGAANKFLQVNATPDGIIFDTIKMTDIAAATSADLAGVISDETGSGKLVFDTSPTFTTQITTPNIVLTNILLRDTTDGTMYISGGNAYNDGGRIVLTGSTHATLPNIVRIRASALTTIDSRLTIGNESTDPGDNNLYIVGDCSALTFTDRTPFYEGDALSEIKGIRGNGKGGIEHKTLPEFAKSQHILKQLDKDTGIVIEEIEERRNIGNMVSILTVAIQQLIIMNEQMQIEINKFEKK